MMLGTFGKLFRASQKDVLKLTIFEQIWLIITDVINELSGIFNLKTKMQMEKLFFENEILTKHIHFKNLPQAG
jgi:hypothetical protein